MRQRAVKSESDSVINQMIRYLNELGFFLAIIFACKACLENVYFLGVNRNLICIGGHNNVNVLCTQKLQSFEIRTDFEGVVYWSNTWRENDGADFLGHSFFGRAAA